VKTLVVVNPHSSNSRTGRRWPTIRNTLHNAIGQFEEGFTHGPDHATQLVREGLKSGAKRIISVGGDGTNNEVINGFFDDEKPINPDAQLGFVPRGTGGDLRKTLGIGRDLSSWQTVLIRAKTKPMDVGLVEYVSHTGETARRYFVNITSFGIGGLVDTKVNQSTKVFGGKISFMIGTVKAIAAYKNKLVNLTVKSPDGSTVFDKSIRINNIAVANGQYFGGGMWVAPKALMDDGLFDVVILGDMTRAQMIFKASRIYKGTHLDLPEVFSARGSLVEATSEEEVLIDMDGEQPGRLPIRLEIVPKAINFIVP